MQDPLAGYRPDWRTATDDPLAGYRPDWRTTRARPEPQTVEYSLRRQRAALTHRPPPTQTQNVVRGFLRGVGGTAEMLPAAVLAPLLAGGQASAPQAEPRAAPTTPEEIMGQALFRRPVGQPSLRPVTGLLTFPFDMGYQAATQLQDPDLTPSERAEILGGFGSQVGLLYGLGKAQQVHGRNLANYRATAAADAAIRAPVMAERAAAARLAQETAAREAASAGPRRELAQGLENLRARRAQPILEPSPRPTGDAFDLAASTADEMARIEGAYPGLQEPRAVSLGKALPPPETPAGRVTAEARTARRAYYQSKYEQGRTPPPPPAPSAPAARPPSPTENALLNAPRESPEFIAAHERMNGFRDAVKEVAASGEPIETAIQRIPAVRELELERPGAFAEWVGLMREAQGKGITLYANPMFDPALLMRTLGKRGLVGAGVSTAGYVMSQSDNDAIAKTGKAMIPLGIATIVGMRAIRRLGAVMSEPLVKALAETERGRAIVDYIDPEILLAPEARQAILGYERGRAKGRARGTELSELAARQGPEADRKISDWIEAEDFERANLTPAQTETVLAAATRIGEEFSGTARQLVEQGQLAARTVAKREGRYLPRMYPEHLADEAAGTVPAQGGRAVRIRGYKQRRELSPEWRTEHGEVREASFRTRRGLEHAYGDIAAGKLFTALREIPGTLHPEFERLAGDALTSTQMFNEARAAAKALRKSPDKAMRQTALEEYRAAWGQRRQAQRALDVFRLEFRPGKGNWQSLPDTKGMGPLRGAVVQREVAMALKGYDDMPHQAFALMRFWKKSKTVWNPGTHVGNTASNTSLAHMAGLSIHEQPRALLSAGKDLVRYGPLTRELAEAGVLGQGMAAVTGEGMGRVGGDLSVQLRELARTTRPETAAVLARKGLTPEVEAVRLARIADAKARRLYNNEDNVFRVALYEKAIRPTAQGGMGMPRAEAAEYVRYRMVNYRSVSPLLSLMRNTVYPFAIWPAKALPMLAAGIVEHPVRWLSLMSLGGLLDQYSKWAVGRPNDADTPPELREGGAFGYVFPTSIQLPFKGKRGERYFFDPSRWLPFSSVTTGAPPGTTVGAISQDVPGVVQPSGPIVDVAARALNRQPYSGEPWISPSDRPLDIARKGAGAVAQLALPSALGFHAPRIAEQLTNRDYPTAASQSLGLLGLRPRTTRIFGYADRLDANLSRELQAIAIEYNRKTREAEQNPARVVALEEERARKEEAAYRRYERKMGVSQ